MGLQMSMRGLSVVVWPVLLAAPVSLALSGCTGGERESSTDAPGFVTSATNNQNTTITTSPASGSGSSSQGASSGGMSGGTSGTSGSTGDDSATTEPDPTATTTNTTNTTNTTSSSTTSGDPTTEPETTGEMMACGAIEETAEVEPLPADIIFAVDTSGSMNIEFNSVQNNMNAFSSQIVNSGVDAHVVLISSNDMCIAAPLGSGNCPSDTNEDGGYLHVMEGVGSNNAFDKILQTQPMYADFLRPNALKHVIVVSDDNANMNANTFKSSFEDFGPEYEGFRFHAIVGLNDADDVLWCIQNAICCAFVANEGSQYKNLVGLTGGLLGDLCDQEFGPIFNELSTVVVDDAELPCEFLIPEPDGMDIDFGKVNVELDVDNNPVEIPKVDDLAGCDDVVDGWYYDDNDNPEMINLCPDTCAKVQGDENAGIDVKFGCETLIPE